MGQCRSKMSEISQMLPPLPSYSEYRQNRRKHKTPYKGKSRDIGIYPRDASFSESSFGYGGGQGLLSSNSDGDLKSEPIAGNKKKIAFDYYGGTIEDSIAEEKDESLEQVRGKD